MKRIIAAICAAAMCLCCTGCTSIYSSYRDAERLALVQTIGLDPCDQGVTLTISAGKSNNAAATLMSLSGKSISDTVSHLQQFATREEITYAHIEYVLLGEEEALRGVERCLDFFGRAVEVRMDTNMFVIRGGSAKDLITKSTGEQSDITQLLTAIDSVTERCGTSYAYSCQDVARALLERGSALVCAIEVNKTEDVIFTDGGELSASPLGYGIIKDGYLCGYIMGEMARGVNFLQGHGGADDMTIETDQLITVNLSRDSCTIKPVWSADGSLEALEVDCKLGYGIAEFSSSSPHLSDDEVERINKTISEKVAGWFYEILSMSQLLEADFLGICNNVRAASPMKFSKIEDTWISELKEAELRISVSAEIVRDYNMGDPLQRR